jgi:hypothetical protein
MQSVWRIALITLLLSTAKGNPTVNLGKIIKTADINGANLMNHKLRAYDGNILGGV